MGYVVGFLIAVLVLIELGTLMRVANVLTPCRLAREAKQRKQMAAIYIMAAEMRQKEKRWRRKSETKVLLRRKVEEEGLSINRLISCFSAHSYTDCTDGDRQQHQHFKRHGGARPWSVL